MTSSHTSRPRHLAPTLSAASFAALLAAFTVGCASPGPPRPPSLHLPQPVTDLTAQRIGDDVHLHWTTPTKTTDELNLTGTLTAQLCREALPPTTPPTCTPILRLPVKPGPSTATEALPATLTSDPARLLIYRVRIENVAGRSAAPSNPAYAAAGAAPPPIQNLHASAIKAGAILQWNPLLSNTIPGLAVELDRLNPALVATPKPTQPKAKQPLQLAGQESPEVHLRATSQNTATTTDPGGTLDPTAQKGETYTYTAQRVRTLQLNGQQLQILTPPSPPVTITLRDIFQPPTPTGLAAIPGTATPTPTPTPAAPPQPSAQPSIDLSWQPVSDPDLAGYLVYRQPAATPNAPFTRLTPTPIPGSAFSDLTATPGQTYTYHVTSIDKSGNESSPSNATQETLPTP
jgi:hypothetical protein